MSLFQMPVQRTTNLQAFIHVSHAGLREVGGCHADTAPQVFVFYKVQEDAVQEGATASAELPSVDPSGSST